MQTSSALIFAGLLLTAPIFPVWASAGPDSEASAAPGQRLFLAYGCGNCHGNDGVSPTSAFVPLLKGKSRDYILTNAGAIFSGERSGGNASLMHNQYCSGDDGEQICDQAPSPAELAAIADWLTGSVPLAKKKTTPQGLYLSAIEAFEMVRANPKGVLFVDIRSRPEVAFLGMPTVAHANIPYLTMGFMDEWDDKKGNFRLVANNDFLARFETLVQANGMSKDSPVILMCRSGSRSSKAARVLYVAGYRNVYSVTEGYEGDKAKQGPLKGQRVVNGWKNSGLPWSYKLDPDKMYWEL